jgi:hypothetical protein
LRSRRRSGVIGVLRGDRRESVLSLEDYAHPAEIGN